MVNKNMTDHRLVYGRKWRTAGAIDDDRRSRWSSEPVSAKATNQSKW